MWVNDRRAWMQLEIFTVRIDRLFQDSSWIEEGNYSNYPVCLCLNRIGRNERDLSDPADRLGQIYRDIQATLCVA